MPFLHVLGMTLTTFSFFQNRTVEISAANLHLDGLGIGVVALASFYSG